MDKSEAIKRIAGWREQIRERMKENERLGRWLIFDQIIADEEAARLDRIIVKLKQDEMDVEEARQFIKNNIDQFLDIRKPYRAQRIIGAQR